MKIKHVLQLVTIVAILVGSIISGVFDKRSNSDQTYLNGGTHDSPGAKSLTIEGNNNQVNQIQEVNGNIYQNTPEFGNRQLPTTPQKK